jgi:hypothetical protein
MRALVPLLFALAQAAPAPSTSDSLVSDVRRLSAAADPDGRFAALTALLNAHNLRYTVEDVMLDKTPPGDIRTRGRNVVVTVGKGTDQIVVGAHYDAKRLMDGSLSKGAVDNGASSVILVRVAEALQAKRLRTRVTFVWFDFEENGLLGSAKYLERHAGDRIKAMINYDINAYGDTVLFGPPIGGADPRLGPLFLEACAAEKVDCLRFDGMPPGDDRTFGAKKIPSLSVAILPATEAHQLWLMLQAKSAGLAPGFQPPIFGMIHTPGDTPEKLDGAGMATAQRLATAFIRRLSDMRP